MNKGTARALPESDNTSVKGKFNYRKGTWEDGLVDVSIYADGTVSFYGTSGKVRVSSAIHFLEENHKKLGELIKEIKKVV